MTKKGKVVWGIVSVVGIIGLGFTAKYFVCGSCKMHRQALTKEQRYSLANELVRIVREEHDSVLRQWLLKQSPNVSGQAILSLDNTNDPTSRARLAALNAIYSLDAMELSDEARKGWALVLRDLASSILHAGEKRTEFVAKSYLLERQADKAAATYRLIPQSLEARHFFGENPDFRAPASKK